MWDDDFCLFRLNRPRAIKQLPHTSTNVLGDTREDQLKSFGDETSSGIETFFMQL